MPTPDSLRLMSVKEVQFMAKLVVSILSSLDGYCAGLDGQLDALPMGSAFDAHNLGLMRNAGTYLFGAITFPMFEGYWPRVDRGPDGDPIAREIAEQFDVARKLVVSDTFKMKGSSPWSDTEVVQRSDSHRRIAELKARSERDLLIFGSHTLTNDMLVQGMVDEFYLLVGNVVLGEGVRTFDPCSNVPFKLLGQRRLVDSDIVALHYDCRQH